jgi:hypothetical protein
MTDVPNKAAGAPRRGATAAFPLPRTNDAVAFLENFRPGGPWHLVAIKDDQIRSRSFDQPDQMKQWIDKQQGTRNLYFHVNQLHRKPRRGKATKADVASATYLHVDVDDLHPKTLERLRAHQPAPSIIVNSGGGFQAFWKLVEPCRDLDQVESRNKDLAKLLGGDNCHNIDRIMRLPGTINILSAKKIARGRVPALAHVVEVDWSRRYALEQFLGSGSENDASPVTTTTPPYEVQLLGIDDVPGLDDKIKVLLAAGDDLQAPRDSASPHYKSRSEALFGAITRLVRAGYDDLTIAGLILNTNLKISESVVEKPKPKEYAFRQITKAKATIAESISFPDLTRKGLPRPTLPNTKIAVQLLGVKCRYDLFRLRYLIDSHRLETFIGEVSDPALLRLRELIHERFGFDPTTETVLTAVHTLSNHARFHPVRDYLDSLQWDGIPRIRNWLTTYGGADDKPFTQAIGALLLIAAVRRVRRPGCKFDELVVLESGQGTNKSQALRVLAVRPEWFSDNLPLGLSSRETIEAMSGHWIIEVSELQGIRKSEIEKIKAFLSRDTDRARSAYAKTVTEAPRQCVVIGTTNSEQYLRDLTGNRRFWPVRVARFDLEMLIRDRDQLWAEAAQRETVGESIRLPEELWPAAAHEQQQRIIENPFASVLDHILRESDELVDGVWVEGKALEGKLSSEDAWTAVGIRAGQRTQQNIELLGYAMKQLGWERKRLRDGQGGRLYMYVKGNEPYRRIMVCAGDNGGPATAHYVTEPRPNF